MTDILSWPPRFLLISWPRTWSWFREEPSCSICWAWAEYLVLKCAWFQFCMRQMTIKISCWHQLQTYPLWALPLTRVAPIIIFTLSPLPLLLRHPRLIIRPITRLLPLILITTITLITLPLRPIPPHSHQSITPQPNPRANFRLLLFIIPYFTPFMA